MYNPLTKPPPPPRRPPRPSRFRSGAAHFREQAVMRREQRQPSQKPTSASNASRTVQKFSAKLAKNPHTTKPRPKFPQKSQPPYN